MGRRGPKFDLQGMPADVLEMLPGYGMAFCPTFAGFGPSERLCRWQQALLATAAAGNRGDDCTIKPRPSLVAQYQLTNLDE
jgi:hypothetical protein